MDIETELDNLCEHIATHYDKSDLELKESIKFMREILPLFPYFHSVICEDAESRYELTIDPADITKATLNPHLNISIREMHGACITDAVNEQISDCINHNEINKPDPNEDWQDRIESRIGCAG